MPQKALLICDMLNDFIQPGAPLEVPGGRNLIPAIQREMEKARREGTPIIYVCDSHGPGDPELNVWPPHALKGTPGAEIIPELQPREDDLLVEKTRYDAFYNTGLESILRSLGVIDIILTGVCTEICIHYTGVGAIQRGFRVLVPEDCVHGLSEADSASALRMLKQVLQPASAP
ncbi:MAG TPA: isochorismatase family cysteine hydrolase [bacterium]|nr:cysteine hydrolase [Candidatus Omnitrophota bacterium]HOJ60660.1 isochorismatase family cysteine hydrolase [bacterium]HOQ90961.1 isochorismatase family cysteine hydrolase [Candidatus Hydrogenedentota bacterium]HOL93880.1 isochorismatase family cysteine hydrolase [bacterium]HPP00441.1 isochorismatase family cysteine hydrolase [bacterium]